MGKSVFKDLIREIKGSLGRFISIMAITAIGAAFLQESQHLRAI